MWQIPHFPLSTWNALQFCFPMPECYVLFGFVFSLSILNTTTGVYEQDVFWLCSIVDTWYRRQKGWKINIYIRNTHEQSQFDSHIVSLVHRNVYICTALLDFLQLRFNSIARPATILEPKQSNMFLLTPGLAAQKYTLGLSGYPRATPFWIHLGDMDPKWSAAHGCFHVTWPTTSANRIDRRQKQRKWRGGGWNGRGNEYLRVTHGVKKRERERKKTCIVCWPPHSSPPSLPLSFSPLNAPRQWKYARNESDRESEKERITNENKYILYNTNMFGG